MKKETSALVKELTQKGEDFEFFPTTKEMVEKIHSYLIKQNYHRDIDAILDIGCGNGNFFTLFDEVREESRFYDKSCYYKHLSKFGIEKAQTLINEMPDDIVLLGTDAMEQSYIEKKMSLIFCNPPYSEYITWAEKIILEGNSPYIVLILPERWKKNDIIQKAIKRRKMETTVFGGYNYKCADRKARGTVDIVVLEWMEITDQTDPFSVWWDSTFSINAEKSNVEKWDYLENEKSTKKILTDLVVGENVVKQLVTFYLAELEEIYETYKDLEKINAKLLKELNVNIPTLKKGLKKKFSDLKSVYWHILFSKFSPITERLTSWSRDKVIRKLQNNETIDFTEGNIYALTIAIIKKSNAMYDEQLKHYFFQITDPKAMEQYKSNKRFSQDDWRFLKELSHRDVQRGQNSDKCKPYLKMYQLDYRIVYENGYNFTESYNNRVSESYKALLNDTITIAKNLGMSFGYTSFDSTRNIEYYKHYEIFYFAEKMVEDTLCREKKLFVDVRTHKNGNVHFKFCTEFMRRLNIEAGRLNGWIQDKQQAVEDFELTPGEIDFYWNRNTKLLSKGNVALLEFTETAKPKKKTDYVVQRDLFSQDQKEENAVNL